MITGPSADDGMEVTSPLRMLIKGCPPIASVTRDEKTSRSTASAAPAGTRASSAHRMTNDPSRRISSLRRPTALSSLSPRKEFEQTSSARPSVLWTAVGLTGRISCRTTGTPRDAACHAASLPASPPPTIVTRAMLRGRQLFGLAHVRTLLGVADQLPAVPLGDLLDEERRAAVGALFGDRTIPEREVAVGIVGAAEEHLAAARLALDDVAAVLRAEHAGRLLLDVLAGRIAAARGELAETSLLDHQVRLALRALLVEDLVRLGRGDPLLGRDDLPRRLALGIAGAGEELAEAAALHRHRLAAVLAVLLDRFPLAARLGGLEL